MLRERFAVDVGVDWSDEELAERIGGYHGILIRSATKLTADLIGRADNLRVIGPPEDGKGNRLNSGHPSIPNAVFCLKKKKIVADSTYKLASPDAAPPSPPRVFTRP